MEIFVVFPYMNTLCIDLSLPVFLPFLSKFLKITPILLSFLSVYSGMMRLSHFCLSLLGFT